MRSVILVVSATILLSQSGFSQLNTKPVLTFWGDSPFDCYGWDIGTDGDLNGDGSNDIVITRFSLSAEELPDTGKALIFFGGSLEGEIPTDARDVEIVGEQAQDLFGFTVVSMGDVNGDGIDDLLMTAPAYDNFAGRTYIFFGGSSWPSELTADQANIIITPGELQYSEGFGLSGTLAGDYNGDGVSDLVISANYGNDHGQVFLFWGPLKSGILPADSADIRIIGENMDDLFGLSAGNAKAIVAGDVNGDGKDDLIIGAYGYDGTDCNIGRVYIFYGDQLSPGLTPGDANVIITGKDTEFMNDFSFGSSILTVDVDADGKGDILVGEFGDDLNPEFIGSFYLFLGSSLTDSMEAEDAEWKVTGTQSQQFYSGSWSALGDIDGNSQADMIFGSRLTNAVYVFTHSLLGEAQITVDADTIITGDDQTVIGRPFTGDIIGSSKPELLISGVRRISPTDSIGVVWVYDDIGSGVSEETIGNLPPSIRLSQNYPNPFNPSTAISYSIKQTNLVQLTIYDQLGRLVRKLVNENQSADEHSVVWDGRNQSGKLVASGIYFYTLKVGEDISVSRKMILLK